MNGRQAAQVSVLVIYHPHERPRAEPIARSLEDAGLVPVMAPAGVQVGSDEWVSTTRTDIQRAHACVFLLTEKSVCDVWVAQRTKWALETNCPFFPVVLGDSIPAAEHWVIPQSVGYFNQFNCQYPAGVEVLVDCLKRAEAAWPVCFVSYSRHNSEFVTRLRNDLDRERIATWRDTDDIPAGAAWDDRVEMALRSCSHVLLVVSAASIQSENVADEIACARDRRKPILPLLLDQSSLPFRVRRAQAIDFCRDYDAGFKKLLSSVRQPP